MYATLIISWVCLPPELEKSSIASPVCSSLGNESFSLFYIIINDQFPSIMCGVFDVETEHGLFTPHRPHSEGSCLLPRAEGCPTSPILQPHWASRHHPAPNWDGGAGGGGCGRRARAFIFLAAFCMACFFICCPVACCALAEL